MRIILSLALSLSVVIAACQVASTIETSSGEQAGSLLSLNRADCLWPHYELIIVDGGNLKAAGPSSGNVRRFRYEIHDRNVSSDLGLIIPGTRIVVRYRETMGRPVSSCGSSIEVVSFRVCK